MGPGVARWEVLRGWQDRRSAGRGEDGEVICGRWGTPSMSGWPCWDLMCMTGSRWCRRRPRRGFRGAVAGGLSLARGATGLRRAGRADQGRHRLPDELLKVIEGMALRRPPPHAAEVHRAAVKIATEQGWKTPSYTVVGEVTVGLDRGLLALAPLPAGKSKKGVDGRRQQRTGADRSVIARSYRRGETPARSPAGLHHRALCEPVAPCAASRWRLLLHQAM